MSVLVENRPLVKFIRNYVVISRSYAVVCAREGRKSHRKSSDSGTEKLVYITTKDCGLESIRIQSIRFFHSIQSIRIRDESGDFWHPPFVCKREKESGAKKSPDSSQIR